MDISKKIFSEFGNLDDDSVMLAFRGQISEELLDSLLNIAEMRLKQLECQTKIRKKAFHILVECLQNLFKHANEGEECFESNGMVMMLVSDGGIDIATGNTMNFNNAFSLWERLNTIRETPTEDIKQRYKEQLVNGKMTFRGGAGLGFLDIARKSNKRLNYDFSSLGDGKFFFTFNVNVA